MCTTAWHQWIGTTFFCATRNFELSRRICPFPQKFYVFAEFCGNQYWMVIRGQIRHILMEFGPPYCVYTWFHHKIRDCHSGSDGRNTENIKLSLSEILPVNLVDSLYLSVAVTGDKYCIFGRVQRHRKLITICDKFAAVSCGIWQTGPRNWEKFAAENCGHYRWTLFGLNCLSAWTNVHMTAWHQWTLFAFICDSWFAL